jgi:RNA polymerase-binding protein DksA
MPIKTGLAPVPRIPFRNCLVATMDLPTQAHLKTLRNLLTYRRTELEADIRAAEQRRRPAEDAATRGVSDRKDEAAEEQLSVVDERGEERDRRELAEVEAALHRFDAGTYGDCESCGEPIVYQRLLAQPAAARCAACQRELEAGAARPA